MPFKDAEKEREWNRQWARKNRERFREYNARWKRMSRFRKYGLTFDDYMALLEKQDFRCAICRKEKTDNRRFAIDHDHNTGKVRGLLCDMCNTALGKLGDTAEGVSRALDYLRGNVVV